MLAVAFSPDGKTLADASNPRTLRLWNPATGELTAKRADLLSTVYSLAFSPDGETLASSDNEGTAWLQQHPPSGRSIIASGGETNAVAFSPDGRTLAGAGRDGRIRFWDPRTGRLTATLTGHTGNVGAVAFSPDGKILASGADDDTVRLWKL
ncbi:WD40 repeat domain-containing protein [Priestia megaterium]|uniref:WD40 repeat domain-containing protein n=1 Tax=Priestia megaterium TaxID=1404 RepID=UPI0036DB4596